jgi:cellulose synthase (UDP-forming)
MFNSFQNVINKNEELYKVFRQDSHLPKAPTDIEKYIYKNGDFKFYAIVALIASGLAVYGQIVWVLKDKDRFSFLLPIFVFTMFTLLTYGGAFARRTFNRTKHDLLVSNYSTKFKNSNKINKNPYPSVDIYLTTCGEGGDVIENASQYIAKVQWYGHLNVYILDDKGNNEIKAIANKYKFNYIHRPNPGYLKKAGNIRYAFTKTKGDYFVIFDADFCPRNDFLTETMPYFDADNKIGLLQTPQYFHLTEDSNYIEIGSTAKEELFYRCIQPSRDSFQSAMCVGTNAIYKREAVAKMGGVAALEHSEDIHTGFGVATEGWKVKYLPIVLAKGVAPSTINAYFNQQYRWGLGTLMQIFDKNFWFAKIPFIVKLNYINSIFYYLNVSTGVVVNVFPVVLSVMFFSNDIKADEVLIFLPLFIFTFIFHPLWQKTPWSIKCVSANMIANTSYLFALFDLITGSVMEWVPTGQTQSKSSKKMRYYQFFWFLILWHLITNSIILYFALMNMNKWDDYRMYPIIFFAIFNLIVTSAILEPINNISKALNTVFNFFGLKIIYKQLTSISLVASLLIVFSTITAFAMNKEGRSNILNTVNSISINRSNANSLIPTPVINFNKKENIETVKTDTNTTINTFRSDLIKATTKPIPEPSKIEEKPVINSESKQTPTTTPDKTPNPNQQPTEPKPSDQKPPVTTPLNPEPAPKPVETETPNPVPTTPQTPQTETAKPTTTVAPTSIEQSVTTPTNVVQP